MKFGQRLNELLKENTISQATLANSIGVSQRTVSKWINQQSEPTESSIVNCCLYFKVSADYMLGLKDY